MRLVTPTQRVLDAWPWFAGLAAAGMLSAAHGFESFMGLAPCPLCLRQREVYWAALTLAAVYLLAQTVRFWRPKRAVIDLLLAALFLTGALVAGFHAGGEAGLWKLPASCAGGEGPASLDALLAGASSRVVRCDEVAWRAFGISMAGWNALTSLALAGVSWVAALREARR